MLAAVLFALVLAAPASADVAPGRVAYPIADPIRERTVDAAFRVAGGAALPDGGALLIANPVGGGFTVLRLRADGSVAARRGVRAAGFHAVQVLPLPDGRALVTGTVPAARRFEQPRLAVIRLTAELALDPAYGVAQTAIQGSCANCQPIALQPDGSLYVTGHTGEVRPQANPGETTSPPDMRWVVARIGPNGETGPPVQVVNRSSGGYGVGVTASGRIVTFGHIEGKPHLVALRPDGSADPDFNGGAPLAVPGFLQMMVRPDGRVEVLGSGTLARVTADGKIAHVVDFGRSDAASLDKLLPASSGGTLVYRGAFDPTPTGGRLTVWHIAPDGRVDAAFRPRIQFGGGLRPGQDSFRVTDLLQRPDGSFLAVGGLALVRYTGEGTGYSRGFFAVAALTGSLLPDERFGGPAIAPAVTVQVRGVRRERRFTRVRLRVTSATPGLVLLRVRDERGRLLAQGVEPIYAAGTSTVDVTATKSGEKRLRRVTRVRAGHDFRDLFGASDSDVTRGRLR